MMYKATAIPRLIKINDYSSNPPGSFLFIDFSFYNVVSIRGFTSVLDVIYTSTRYSFTFPIRSKRPPIKILRWLFSILQKEGKEVRIVRVDEGRELARSREFFWFIVNQNCALQTTGGYCSSLNRVIDHPHQDGHSTTRISLGCNKHIPEKC